MTVKMSSPLHKIPWVFWLCLVLGGAAIICCSLFLAVPLTPRGTSTELTRVDSEGIPAETVWEVYVTEDGKIRSLLDEGWNTYSGLAYEGQTFYAACTLDATYDSAVLELLTPFPTALFLDDTLLYADGVSGTPQIGEVEFLPSDIMRQGPLLVSLPPDYAGHRLTIAQSQMYGTEEPVSDVYIPASSLFSEKYADSQRLAEGADVFYPGVALFILGILLLIMLAAEAYHGGPIAPPAILSGFCLLWMIYLYLSSIPLQLLEYYDALQPFSALFYYGSTACLVLFMAGFMQGKWRLILGILAVIPAAVSALTAIFIQADPALLDLIELPEGAGLAVLLAAIVFAFMQSRTVKFYRTFIYLFGVSLGIFLVFLLVQGLIGSDWFRHFSLQWETGVTLPYLNSLLRTFLITACFSDLVFEFMQQIFRRRTSLLLAEERIRLADASLGQFRQQARETAMLQHDIRRHLGVVGRHLREGEVDEAMDYLEEIGLQLDSVPKTVQTGNGPIDMILNSKLSEIRELEIGADILAEELPRNLPLSEAETASLLLNTLDNAIRAAQAADPKELTVRIYARNGFLYYSCRNTMTPETRTDEKEENGHGYGLQIIRQIVEKLDGLLQIRQKNGRFQVTCVLPLSPGTDTK